MSQVTQDHQDLPELLADQVMLDLKDYLEGLAVVVKPAQEESAEKLAPVAHPETLAYPDSRAMKESRDPTESLFVAVQTFVE